MSDIEFVCDLIIQENLELLSPKLEQLKKTEFPINIIQGGRAAGAKSHGIASLILQRCNKELHKCVCLREVFGSLEESVYTLMCQKIKYLRQKHWVITKTALINKKTGSKIIFRGLIDLRAGQNIKGLEGFDIWWFEEAQMISEESLSLAIPTMVRNKNYSMYITYNPETEFDPVTLRYWNSDRDDILKIRCESGTEDNPWWNSDLTKEMQADFERDKIWAEHCWNGHPLAQSQRAVFSTTDIRAAMERNIENPIGTIEIGADVARFGRDKTVMYKRKGFKILERRELSKMDTQEVADELWDFAGRNPALWIKVDDTGLGGGVTDKLRRLGANVIPINFAQNAQDIDRYTDVVAEMWHTFPILDVDLPENSELMQQLSGRQYGYDKIGRKNVEPKEGYKKRLKNKMADDADALLLCFYETESTITPEIASALKSNWSM